MRVALILVLILASAAMAQPQNLNDQAQMIRQTVGAIAGSDKTSVEVVLRDLREFEGKVIGVYDDHFVLRRKKKKDLKWTVISIGTNPNRNPTIFIRYRDVLQIEGKNAVASFVPDPAATRFATWDQVNAIGRGEFVQIHFVDGKKTQGVYYRSDEHSLSLMRGNREVAFHATQVSKIFRVKGDTRGLATKIITGGTRGAEISEDWFPLLDPRSLAHPLATAIGAAVGATIYVLPFGKTSRVLVYSK